MDPCCPDRGELMRFAIGDLTRPALDRIGDHVSACAHCETVLQEIDEGADPLLLQLRDIGGKTVEGDAPLPPELIRAARAGRVPMVWSTLQGERRLGKFELQEELGVGSFGSVFRARDTELDRTVAIKILRAGKLATREELDRFFREARSAAQLKHPSIVSIFDTGQTEDGTCYLVEELVQGETLADWFRRSRRDIRVVIELVARVADALAYAHQNGVIHRDVKPSNIMVDREGQPHLMDFGLAKREADETLMTLEGQVLGTPAYMSPEQARGEAHDVDDRSDIFSLGVILYELMTGERPFRGNRRMLLEQVLQDEPRSPRRLNDKIPRDLETICQKAMAKVPTRRYSSAREMAEDLRRWLTGEPIRARPIGARERIWRWCRRNPVPASLLVAVTLGSAFGFWHLSRLSEFLVRSTALESVKQQAEMLEEVDKMYTSEVVERLKGQNIEVTHDYRNKTAAIPLPATLNIDLGQRVSERSVSGMQVRLFSDYPFTSRTGGGPKDEFERQVLLKFRENPDETIDQFETYQGRPSLRFAKARRMGETCVQCHNQHKESIKKDWKVGEVGGVLEIIRPLDQDIARTRAGLRGTFFLVTAVSGSMLALSGLVLWNRRRPPGSMVGGN